MWNENFHGIGEKLVPTKAAPIAIINLLISHWSLSRHKTREKKPHIQNRILGKAAGLNQLPVWGKGVCSDSNRTAQRLQMAACKSFEMMSGMILNRLQTKFAAMKCDVLKRSLAMWWVWWPGLAGRASIFDLKIFWAICHRKHSTTVLLTNHPKPDLQDLSWSPKFQVISSHFLEVYELLSENWAKIVQSEKISTPIFFECDKRYQSKDCVQGFTYFVSGLDIQLQQSENNSPVRKTNGCRWRNTTSHIPFFFLQLIWTNGLVVKNLRPFAESRATLVWFLMSAETLQPLGHFAWHWARQCTDMRAYLSVAI